MTMLPMSFTIITTSILNSLNKEKLTLAYYMSGAVALIASIFFMPKYIGVDSLIAGMFLSYAITSVLNLIAIARVCPEKINVSGYIFKSAIFIIPSFLAGYFVNNLLKIITVEFVSVIISAAVSVLFSLLLYFISGMLDFDHSSTLSCKRRKGIFFKTGKNANKSA